MERREWVSREATLSVARQCALLSVSRSVIYAKEKRLQEEPCELDVTLLQLLDKEYTRHPFYGSPRMTHHLHGCGHAVSRNSVQGLMRKLGLAGMAPGPHTSKPQPEQKVSRICCAGLM